ncbi:MAG: hypothetical protein LBF34_03550 [Puniceicoccales bacterium]|nr:hypothetical protein [Puniceicoccales bacterium]
MVNITYWEKFVPIRENLQALSIVRYIGNGNIKYCNVYKNVIMGLL